MQAWDERFEGTPAEATEWPTCGAEVRYFPASSIARVPLHEFRCKIDIGRAFHYANLNAAVGTVWVEPRSEERGVL